jgi:hypothetical protein
MATAELTHPANGERRPSARVTPRRQPGHDLIVVLATVWGLTAVGGLVGLLAPGLAPAGAPHPTLHGSVTDMLSILATNLRLLSVPFALALLGFQRSRRRQPFGDLLVSALVTLNTVRVGLALGRNGTKLIPYIPQLPVEWLALALSVSAWIAARHGMQPRALRRRALQTLLAAGAAAALEALLTPHAR